MSWQVPRMWEEGDVWIIGGGPSLPQQFEIPDEVVQRVQSEELPPSTYSPYLAAIHDKHVIAVNSGYLLGDWIDMVFFGDKGWWLNNRKRLAKFPGLKVSCHPKVDSHEFVTEHIKYVAKDRDHTKGLSPNPGMISWNLNSGGAAMSVAANTGVKRIILLGFDMRLGTRDKQHWHGLYGTAKRRVVNPRKLPFHRHLRGFPAIAEDAKNRNIEILNACPNSKIDCFRKVTVKEVLQ